MNQAEHIISKFGGISAMATRLGHRNSSTVQGWHERGVIPSRRYSEILQAGKGLNDPIVPEDFVRHLAEEGDDHGRSSGPADQQRELPLQAAE